ncbi:MOSC domain-containing protein [Streptomyces albus]|uniref:MOSC domain-containing protein n=1 Tax=Streptomyces albus TaxID=1888 RepID=UPI0033E5F62C
MGCEDVEVVREGEISHFDQLPVSVLTTATLDRVRSAVPGVPVDERRFRPNLLVRTPPGTPPFVEDEWFGSKARIGDAVCVEFVRSSERCVMTNEAQQDLPPTPRWCCGPSQKPMGFCAASAAVALAAGPAGSRRSEWLVGFLRVGLGLFRAPGEQEVLQGLQPEQNEHDEHR